MRILVAVDSSACSHAALDEVGDRPWPKSTEVPVLSVEIVRRATRSPGSRSTGRSRGR